MVSLNNTPRFLGLSPDEKLPPTSVTFDFALTARHCTRSSRMRKSSLDSSFDSLSKREEFGGTIITP